MTRTPGRLAQLACLLEVCARKPGNVHPGASFDDAGLLDFLVSATALVSTLDRAAEIGVGEAVLSAVEATRRLTATNTNLGMILLLAPLAAADPDLELRDGLRRVLRGLTVDDARLAFRAICLARPGGLGQVDEHDVATEPTITLIEAMTAAADRDAVARQYATDYDDVFSLTLPTLIESLDRGLTTEQAIVACHLTLMSERPDTLILRKCGPQTAAASAERAGVLARARRFDPDDPGVAAFDAWLRAAGRGRNPGATADLVTAALYVALHQRTIELPEHITRRRWSPH